MARIQAPVYGFYAGNDARIDATLPTAKDQMAAAKKQYDLWSTMAPATASCAPAKIRVATNPIRKPRAAWVR